MLIAIAIFCLVVVEFLNMFNNWNRFKWMHKAEEINLKNTTEILKLNQGKHQVELATMEDYWSHKTMLLEKQIKEWSETLTNLKEENKER